MSGAISFNNERLVPDIQFPVPEKILTVFFSNFPNNPAGYAKRHNIRGDVARNDASAAYYGIIPYRYSGQYLSA
jgi:hypothetical protein